jgi:putative ABC transport system substrate-binding protein
MKRRDFAGLAGGAAGGGSICAMSSKATKAVNLTLFVAKANNDQELSAAFESLAQQRVGALLVATNRSSDTRREQIIALGHITGLRTSMTFANLPLRAARVSYGPRITDGYQQAGLYAGQILEGAIPADVRLFFSGSLEAYGV